MTVVVVTPAGPLHRTLNSTEQKIFFSTKKKPFFFLCESLAGLFGLNGGGNRLAIGQ